LKALFVDMADESGSDEECPELVPIQKQEHHQSISAKNKVPITIITGFLGER